MKKFAYHMANLYYGDKEESNFKLAGFALNTELMNILEIWFQSYF